jgi:hypothetical protein
MNHLSITLETESSKQRAAEKRIGRLQLDRALIDLLYIQFGPFVYDPEVLTPFGAAVPILWRA